MDELKILNILENFSAPEDSFYLETILKLIKSKKEDTVIQVVESLIVKNLIVPDNSNSFLET